MNFLLAAVALFSIANAEYLVESASFGHQHKDLSPNGREIPSWHISGTGWLPQLMSDRVVLTPPYPGAKKGALWAQSSISYPEWTANLEFRAGGPSEDGGGNIQLWYTKENQAQIGSENVYTVGAFDGLVILIDMYGGRSGSVRAFLNDGTIDFKNHPHLEALAFGQCQYAYRNLGRPSRIQLKQDRDFVELLVDGTQCFRTDQVLLPKDYFFGVTATSSETPDSFEVFKFVTYTSDTYAREEPRREKTQDPKTRPSPNNQASEDKTQKSTNELNDVIAASITSQDSRFADLHNRLQSQGHAIDNLFREYQVSANLAKGLHHELLTMLATAEQNKVLERRMIAIETSIAEFRKEFATKDYTPQFNDLHAGLKVRHESLLNSLPEKMGHVMTSHLPNIKFLIFSVVLFQVVLAVAYIVYKRRKASGSKKYL